MSDAVSGPILSALHINKLGHQLEEIRIRALHTIIAKLKYGFINELDLINQRDIAGKLFGWFTFETCPEKELVLNIILRLVKADEDGSFRRQVQARIGELRPRVEPQLLYLLDRISAELGTCPPENKEPQTSGSTRGTERSQRSIGTTATPIVGEVHQSQEFQDLQSSPSPNETPHQMCHGYFNEETSARTYLHPASCFPHLILPWQPLIATDCHVLLAVEESLSSDEDLALLLHTCQFFTDVMLQDFPAEVFLQRPAILRVFLELLDSDRRVCEPVAHCLWKFTSALAVRIRYYSDPNIANLKQQVVSSGSTSSGQSTSASSRQNESTPSQFQEYQQVHMDTASEDTVLQQMQQLSLPQFCLLCLFHTVPHLGPEPGPRSHVCAVLAAELVKLLALCVRPSVWSSTDPVAEEVTSHLTQVLDMVGEVLDKHRSVSIYDEEIRLAYLQLLALARKLLMAVVPLDVAGEVLSRELRSALSASLIDLSVITLFPSLHSDILKYVQALQSPSDLQLLVKYEDCMAVCSSMKSAVKFLKNYDKLGKEVFNVLDESLPSLPFHGNLCIVKGCVEIAVNKFPLMTLDEADWKVLTSVVLKLLSHSDQKVRLEMYELCHKHIFAILGTEQTSRISIMTARQLHFLYNTSILIEIICHGTGSSHKQIKQYAEEMLIHLLKGKLLLPEPAWRHLLESLIPALPLLQSFADQTTALGRAVVKMFDPETSQSIQLPRYEVLKGNLRLLFCTDPLTREEAVSRLTWLMSREERAFEKLPDFSSLRGLMLNSVCLMDRPVDLGRSRMQTSVYTVSCMCQVVELLQAKGVEPAVRRSALTQIAVMLEDDNLHEHFLQLNGENLILEILHKALVDKEFHNFPDSVIPCISILKSLIIRNSKLRQQLSHHPSLFSCIVRAIYLYNGDDRLRPDSSVLLSLLLYSDFIMTVPEPAEDSTPWYRFSLPEIVVQHMRLPFLCHTHWCTSPHTQHGFKQDLLQHEGCSSLLRLCWNIEWFGGLETVLAWPAPPPNAAISADLLKGFSRELRLTEADLNCLRSTAMAHRCRQHLFDVQNATSHQGVNKSLSSLSGYLGLQLLVNGKVQSARGFLNTPHLETCNWWYELPWADTFKRFLTIPPVCPEDEQLLVLVLKILNLFFTTTTAGSSGQHIHWITKLLKDESQPLPGLLLRFANAPCSSDNQNGTWKEICRELLQLVKQCSRRSEDNSSEKWIHIVRAITKNITFSDAQHFYNLAFLDWMLSCLAHLTSRSGWSGTNAHCLYSELITCLVELVSAFHCGKGGASLASFMGLSITRSAVLCMNHLLCEMQNCADNKGWESIWLCSLGADTHATGKPNLSWLPPLWLSRDPVIRAGALQLVAGFCTTRRGCAQLMNGLSSVAGGVWGAGLSFLLEHEEASMVREQAATLLANLSSHNVSTSALCHAPVDSSQEPVTGVQALLSLLARCNFYAKIAITLSRFYIGFTHALPSQLSSSRDGSPMDDRIVGSTPSSEQEGTESSYELEPYVRSTPGLVKAICWLLVNLFLLSPDDTAYHIHKFGLVRVLFKCLITEIPVHLLRDTSPSNILLYTDLLEMQAGICSVLSKCVSASEDCHYNLLQTYDCVHSLLALLDSTAYLSQTSQLVFLRNQLWTSVFHLLTALLSGKQGFEVVRDALYRCGQGSYIATVLMSIRDDLQSSLCYSALTSLMCLLSFESQVQPASRSLQNLLDGTAEEAVEEEEDIVSKNQKALVPPLGDLCNLENIYTSEDSNRDNKLTSSERRPSSYENMCSCIPLSATSKESLTNSNYSNIDSSKHSSNASSDSCDTVFGAELCRDLLRLYEIFSVQHLSGDKRNKTLVIGTLTNLLAVSRTAKQTALKGGLLDAIIIQLREIHVKLSLESADILRRTSDKKRVCPVLKEVSTLFGMLTSFLNHDMKVKEVAAQLGLADLVHKLWVWCCAMSTLLEEALKMLITFTSSSVSASLTLVLTTTVPGVGLRKTPNTMSLLHAIVSLVHKEMNLVNSVYEPAILRLAFQVLTNACQSQECRNAIGKSTLFQCLVKLHPSTAKRHKNSELVELLWLDFLEEFTFYPEGQLTVPKVPDSLELLILLSTSTKATVRMSAIRVLRNISFHSLNRPRLLSSADFLQMVHQKLGDGSLEEKSATATIVWALIANNQKGKLIIKWAGVDTKLQEALNQLRLISNSHDFENDKRIQIINNVLQLIHADNNSARKR